MQKKISFTERLIQNMKPPVCMSLHPVPIMPKSPPHCFYGEDERKRLANDLNFCLTEAHPSKIWSGYMSTIRSINETWNSWRLRSEPALCQANTHQIMALIFLFIHEVSKMLRMTQKPTKNMNIGAVVEATLRHRFPKRCWAFRRWEDHSMTRFLRDNLGL